MSTPRFTRPPIMRHFSYKHLPTSLGKISGPCCELADEMAKVLPDGPEKAAGLRKLMEAKDCFVRAETERGEYQD